MLLNVIVAIGDLKLRKKIASMVSRPDTHLEFIKEERLFWKKVRRHSCDVIIVSRRFLSGGIPSDIDYLHNIPETPSIVVISDALTVEERAQFIAAGFDFVLTTQLEPKVLKEILTTILNKRRKLVLEALLYKRPVAEPLLDSFVAFSPAMKKLVKVAQRVVKSDSIVLILGETGVGKERLAHTIHNEGPRRQNPFIAVNCAALPETLLESELFGHEEGAFTGATRSRRGCFEMAHTGTLFLDEIGEIPTHLQVKLLRALEENRIQRLGGEKGIPVDVRIMAATNRDLEEEVKPKRFRRDLYYRLNVLTLQVPPLRDRKEDVPELVKSYIEYLRPRIGCYVTAVTDEALRMLQQYSWPGNVRELFNVIERAMLLCEEDVITPKDLPWHPGALDFTGAKAAADALPKEFLPLPDDWLDKPLKDIRRRISQQTELKYISHLLKTTGGRVGQAAQKARLNERALYVKMKQYGLHKEDFRLEK